ncbi:MAG: cysteine desulfurase [Bacteroidales bacterium]|nr:cysteine desulfurase [Bacteroidales bacterium]
MINIDKIRADFPILSEKVYGKDLVYFDNGATTHKPQVVIDAVSDFYAKYNSNIHRGSYYLSNISTQMYENARQKVQKFINAKSEKEVIFTKGTTEGLNLIASSFGSLLHKGDEIIISTMEHHANIVPWQMLRDRVGIDLKIIPLVDDFQLDLEAFANLITEKTKLVSVVHVSNTLGVVNPIEKIIEIAHYKGVPVLIDAAQSIQHKKIDVQELDCEFLVFSGHKIYAETGIGVLYGKQEWLEKLPPYQGGGDMIKDVSFEKTEFADLPFKFEAGTTNFVGAHSIAVAIDYLENIGLDKIEEYERKLYDYAYEKLSKIEDIELYATSKSNRISAISFNVKGVHHFDIGSMLDKFGIAVRTGTHCTQPLVNSIGIQGTVRASFSFYNTFKEIDYFIEILPRVINMFK